MDPLNDFEFEHYEKYFGTIREVIKIIEQCPKCGSALAFGHNADKSHLITQETATCGNCDFGQRKLIYNLN